MPKRGPETHQTKKGNQWYFGMKCHTGVDADSGFVHTVEATAADVHDVIAAAKLPGALINASLRAEIFRKKDKEIPQSLAALRDFLTPAL